MEQASVQHRFTKAVDELVDRLTGDRSVIAAILCGSLSHDRVWDKSDVDLVLVTVDDRKVPAGGRALHAAGVNVHALLMPRAEFRKLAEGSLHNSFAHSFLAKGRLLYSHDESIGDLLANLRTVGERDVQLQLLSAGTAALLPVYKAHKWYLTREDLDYTALWILYAATPLARIEVIAARQIADREVIPQAMQLNPGFFRIVYADILNTKKTKASVQRALEAVDAYLAERAPRLFELVLEHLRDVGEARSCTDLEDHFARHFGFEGVTTACEYLADQGLVGKASIGTQLTRRSNVSVEELAFFHLERGATRDGV